MGWTQEYSVEPKTKLYERLLKTTAEKLLLAELARKGIKITKEKKVVLDDDDFGPTVYGCEITLNNGKTYTHKRIKSIMQDGNYGLDTYEFREKK